MFRRLICKALVLTSLLNSTILASTNQPTRVESVSQNTNNHNLCQAINSQEYPFNNLNLTYRIEKSFLVSDGIASLSFNPDKKEVIASATVNLLKLFDINKYYTYSFSISDSSITTTCFREEEENKDLSEEPPYLLLLFDFLLNSNIKNKNGTVYEHTYTVNNQSINICLKDSCAANTVIPTLPSNKKCRIMKISSKGKIGFADLEEVTLYVLDGIILKFDAIVNKGILPKVKVSATLEKGL